MRCLRSAVALGCLGLSLACVIQGQDAGECKPAQDIQDRMPFCGPVVQYTACVPRDIAWLPNLTIEAKDRWIASSFNAFITERIDIESGNRQPDDPTLYNYYVDSVVTRFNDNDDCVNAYKNFFCYMNFPRCNGARESLILCRSVCENFFRACKYPKDMWRCYEPKYYGGEDPEGTKGDQLLDDQGRAMFLRALFPGLPFRSNAFFDEDEVEPLDVCTPSLKNAAPGKFAWNSFLAVAAIAVFACLVLPFRHV